MSERTQRYVFALWTVVDVILSSVLFQLIGLETLILHFDPRTLLFATAAVPIVLLARFVSVGVQPILFAWTRMLSWANAPFLTWAGVRGGISAALALSLPDSPAEPAILAGTCAVVLFSIVVQRSSLGMVVKRTVGNRAKPNA